MDNIQSFSVDKIKFDISIPDNYNDFSVKSYMNEYNVNFNFKDAPFEILKSVYREGDLVIVDKKVYNLHLMDMENYISSDCFFLQDAKEELKTIYSSLNLLDKIIKNGFTKKNRLIVIGGGIIQDISSFTAAIYKRGIKWIFFPTTLLSMSDSCIGSKNSINHNNVKNQIGLFYPPSEIIITHKFLETLEKREIKSGFGEIIKLYATGGSYFWNNYLTYNRFNDLSYEDAIKCLYYSLLIKKQIIEYDEFDKNVRKSLNYGHTFGHALEALVEHKIPHGIAVVYGMLVINDYFEYKNQRFKDVCLDLIEGTQMDIQINHNNLKNLLRNDKKTIGNEIELIYINELGNTLFKKVEITDEFIEKITILINKYLSK